MKPTQTLPYFISHFYYLFFIIYSLFFIIFILPTGQVRVERVHMTFYLYLVLGFLGGIPAGMGMGGGTITIPLLVLLGGVEQKIAQCANLFAFLPMSVGALKTHKENGLLKTQGILWVMVPAFLLSALGASVALSLPSQALKKGFGAFLIVLSFFTLHQAFFIQEKE